MRVAFATSDLARIDRPPLRAGHLMIYEVSEEGSVPLAVHSLTKADPDTSLALLAGCQFIFAASVDPQSAAHLARIDCVPLLSHAGQPIAEALDCLRDRCRCQASRWLRIREKHARRRAQDDLVEATASLADTDATASLAQDEAIASPIQDKP
ncbi:hypothetical protein CKO38_00385 [Rhodospirillum rubrum]|uniref:hypothetical protein n=1 Tax=Rhodospirillum rubrum TaxID=1085 RepID=UPI001906FF2C|nr:hypothetical protein [Rhodospirillum rubrum]MBK1663341.1 hypothetical protein [Rhodospirillum rubrum]MBK1675152.1 hypothetical protein [Rhodospirillum rubrum]